MANYHISKDKKSGDWKIQKEGGQKSSGHTNTQKEAEKIAKNLSANSGGGEVRIHGVNGKIRDTDTVKLGNDPSSIKDTIH